MKKEKVKIDRGNAFIIGAWLIPMGIAIFAGASPMQIIGFGLAYSGLWFIAYSIEFVKAK